MGCCLALLGGSKSNSSSSGFVELSKTVSSTPPTVLDPKYKGKNIQLTKKNKVASGQGLVLGQESLNTDKVYFEVTFKCSASDGAGAGAGAKVTTVAGEPPSKDEPLSKNNSEEKKGKAKKEIKKNPPFQLGVVVRSSVTSRKKLSGLGQPNEIDLDDKARWMWTWGPPDVPADGEEHVLGVAYDQSCGTGTIVIYLNGAYAAGPLPGGIRGIKGTCHPLVVLGGGGGGGGGLRVTATTNFAVNETDFVHPPPEGYGGIIPAVNTL
jgi:hypothetical protein